MHSQCVVLTCIFRDPYMKKAEQWLLRLLDPPAVWPIAVTMTLVHGSDVLVIVGQLSHRDQESKAVGWSLQPNTLVACPLSDRMVYRLI